jgi:hypothetical protein
LGEPVGFGEGLLDLLERYVVVVPSVADVLDVGMTLGIHRVQHGVVGAVELHG